LDWRLGRLKIPDPNNVESFRKRGIGEDVRGIHVHHFPVAGLEGAFVAGAHGHATEQGAPVFEPNEIGLAVQPRIVGGRPGRQDDFVSFAQFAGLLASAIADWAFNFRGAAAARALAGIYGCAALHDDHFADVVLVPGRPFARSIGESLPKVSRGVSSHLHVLPGAAGEFEARTGAFDLPVLAAGRAAGVVTNSIALKAALMVLVERGGGRRGVGGRFARATAKNQESQGCDGENRAAWHLGTVIKPEHGRG